MDTSTSTTPAKPTLIEEILAAAGDLNLADSAAPAKPADMAARDELAELPPALRDAVSKAGSRAFHLAKAEGATNEVALEAGRKAAGEAFDAFGQAAALAAPVVAVAPAPEAPAFPEIPPLFDEPAAPAVSAIPTPPPSAPESGSVSASGRARSQADVDALNAAGFAMKEPIFERGTRVIGVGVKNARRARQAYDRMPLVSEACDALIGKVVAENRRLVEVPAAQIGMADNGQIKLGDQVIDITPNGFAGTVDRLGYRGAAYLLGCAPELRAYNVNAWQGKIATAEAAKYAEAPADKKPSPRMMAARVRDRAPSTTETASGPVVDPGGPELFAMVAPKYPAFDADKVAEAFKLAMPENARGAVRYDPSTTGTRFEALFHTTTRPEDFVAGEVFQTGVRVRANDSGDGSIVVRAIALQNLCLNLIIIDRAGREIARIKHVGTVEELRQEFAAALVKAKDALAPFLRQWGYACREDVAVMLKADGVKLPSDPAEVMRGLFAGVLASKRVRLPRMAGHAREKLLDALVESWRADLGDGSSAVKLYSGITRAAVVNAFTRTAQQYLDAANPFATDEIELDAAKLLWGTGAQKPAPLTFVDTVDLDVEEVAAPALATA